MLTASNAQVSPLPWRPPQTNHRVQAADVVKQLLRNTEAERLGYDRRKEERFAFPQLVLLTPVNRGDLQTVGAPLGAVGKHLSVGGFGFYHHQPLPYQHLVLTVNDMAANQLGLLLRLKWCRFLRDGWYESGGQFVKLLTDWQPETPTP